MTVRILLADDNPAFREGFALLSESLPELDLVGQVATGAEAVRAAARLQPDVVVMDLRMPDLDGVEATRRITAASPHIRVLVLTMLADDDSVVAALRAGASGYVVKGAGQDELLRAIRAVARGEAIFGPAVAGRVLRLLADPPTVAPDPFPELSAREREVLELVAAGVGNAAIARQLGIAEKTVRNRVSDVLVKLQVRDRAHAIVKAREAGLGHGPDVPG